MTPSVQPHGATLQYLNVHLFIKMSRVSPGAAKSSLCRRLGRATPSPQPPARAKPPERRGPRPRPVLRRPPLTHGLGRGTDQRAARAALLGAGAALSARLSHGMDLPRRRIGDQDSALASRRLVTRADARRRGAEALAKQVAVSELRRLMSSSTPFEKFLNRQITFSLVTRATTHNQIGDIILTSAPSSRDNVI